MKLNFAVNNEKNKRMIISNHNDIRPNRLLLKDDPKNNLQNKFNFNINNKKRGRGLLGVTSFETSMATVTKTFYFLFFLRFYFFSKRPMILTNDLFLLVQMVIIQQ